MGDISPVTMSVYEFIRSFIQHKGICPTIREIGQGVHLSHSAVFAHLEKLEAKGWITREIGIARTIRLGAQAPEPVKPAS